MYVGGGGFLKKNTPFEVAVQESINTRLGVERCIRYAFEYCRKKRNRKKLTLCGKTNVLTYASDLWERVFLAVAPEYPDIETGYVNVDAAAMWMIKNPEWFDVIVTDNLFGDIITDIGAIIQGGLGIAAGGNINPEGVSMFEPIGGSAPKYAGQNMINPLAAILASAMMLDHLGQTGAARRIENAVKKTVLNDIRNLSSGKMGKTTREVGDSVVGYIAKER
jgi:3-isopropylmalate dehydrogenase